MPELPEVETVKATLENRLVGKTIKDVEVLYDKMLENISVEDFKNKLINQTLKSFYRYGKYLVFIFEDVSLVSHLRMEGKYFIKTKTDEIVKHEHIIFTFSDSTSLRYHDTRKFGIMAIIDSVDIKEIMKYKPLAKLGEEANVSTNYQGLYDKIKNKNIPIKTLLLDQENLAGLGNIYVDEVCFKSKIHPLTKGCDITLEETKTLLDNARIILAKAIECGGTTIRSYTSSLGVTGRFQINLMVHTKEDTPCINCGTTIIKTVVGGRGTYLCPNCQKEKNKVTVVGITGLISSGKTMVTDYLTKNNYLVIDTDIISKTLLDKDSEYLPLITKELVNKWGIDLVDTFYQDGLINRSILGNIIFSNDNKRQDLNNLMHPIIKKIVISSIKRQKNAIINNTNMPKIIFVAVPLLFEAKYEDICDEVLIIDSNEEDIIKRLMNRDQIDFESAKQKIATQLSTSEKIAYAKKHKVKYYLLENKGSLKDLYTNIDKYLKTLK